MISALESLFFQITLGLVAEKKKRCQILYIYMAVVPICYRMSYNKSKLPIQRLIRQSERGFMCDCIAIQEGSKCLSSISSDKGRRWHVFYRTSDLIKTKTRGVNASRGVVTEKMLQQGENLCMVWYASESNSNEKQLKSLDSYLGKLQNEANRPSSDSSNKMTELVDGGGQFKSKEELRSLEDYLGKLNKDANSESYVPSASDDDTTEGKPVVGPFSISEDSKQGNQRKLKSYTEFRNKDGKSGPEISHGPRQYDETSDFYLISILASINIAVFLFEIASPIRNSELELFSLPLIYGAKINHLILVGEWWRLVTPMFLHSGLFHVALDCWALLTFGPQVSRIYGSFTFFLIYILGGISGNLTSFLHTPEPTVGGTGPVFAIIGAWLIYQIQNKDVFAKDVSESMFHKAIIITALAFILSHFGPIDDWTHFGAAFTGMAYGFFTCPTLQLDDSSSKTGQEEGITLVRRYADPCKSLVLFTIFTLVLSSLLLFIEPPLNMLESNSFL
ncbi:hypothetical protein L1049_002039 [Liquidambar formosana]|uniref:Peptidase S54 rhomboid domain-containing protein n=1 Tax=Liquidambar formosana TaxID=63359 RepID=A0AAP0NGB9_LIQFO